MARSSGDQRGLTAGGNRLSLGTQLTDDTVEDSIDHAQRAIVTARVHAGHRIGADDFVRLAKAYHGQARCLAKQRFNGDADANGDSAAKIFALGGDDIEVDRGAQVHYDARASIFVK